MGRNLLAASHLLQWVARMHTRGRTRSLKKAETEKVGDHWGRGRRVLRGRSCRDRSKHQSETRDRDTRPSGEVEVDHKCARRAKRAALPLVPAPRRISQFPLLTIGAAEADLPDEGWWEVVCYVLKLLPCTPSSSEANLTGLSARAAPTISNHPTDYL